MPPTPQSSLLPIVLGVALLLLIGGGLWYVSSGSSTSDYASNTNSNTVEQTNQNNGVSAPQATPSDDSSNVVELPDTSDATPLVPSSGGTSAEPAQSTAVTPTPTPNPTPTPTPEPKPATTYTYNDGAYSANGSYRTPEGSETIGITLTVKNDLIANATAIIQARDKQSIKYQKIFNDNFKALVVGKKLSEVSLGKVSGASLTPKGFNDAIAKIRTQAAI